MDFYQVSVKEPEKKDGPVTVYPDFIVSRSEDLMVRGRSFYAIWDEERGLWSTDEYDVQRIVDRDLKEHAEKLRAHGPVNVRYLRSFGSTSWSQFRKYVQNISDNSRPLDDNLTFENTEVKKSDYVSKRLPYSLAAGSIAAWDELVGTLYSVEERAKLEWAIGAIVSGDSKRIQKFIVLYGLAGTGKSTILNIIQKLFVGYTATFEAKALGSNNGSFATEAFRDNPLVAIQHDGDLSRIEDNTRLNSIIAHEDMVMNEKYKASYSARVNAFLFMGTNQPVKISDAKSGIIRRLIDVHPTGVRIPANHYHTLMTQIDFELGAIAHHCLQVYLSMGKNYYNSYRPLEMMLQTDVFFNFVEAHFDIFKSQDYTTLKQAYLLYKEYCGETGIDKVLPQYKVREELRNYFDEFKERAEIDGQTVRSVYSGFSTGRFKSQVERETTFALVIDEEKSIFDEEFALQPAQYAKPDGTPKSRWSDVKTTLADLDTKELHYVRVPEHHIVIDFDLLGETGEKSLDRNLEAASSWPPTYAELSKSGQGVHLHYNYDGDVERLSSRYSEGIEVKVYRGNASLRRKLSRCNGLPVATINSGLPLKEEKVLTANTIQSEQGLRAMIARNLNKEFHAGTKPSIDFIHHILEEAHSSGMAYDVSDLRPKLMAFANNSTNQAMTCLKLVQSMKFKSEVDAPIAKTEKPLVFFDVEVYPNLFVVCWKYHGSDQVVHMVNPTPQEVEALFNYRLVGFNNRRYDNHILYARFMGYSNEGLFKLSQDMIVEKKATAPFGAAYSLSYTDIYDFSSVKASLKKFEIELGLHHMEMDIPWDQPVPEDRWDDVVRYCENDVRATEAVFESRKGDFTARQILAELSGLSENHTTQQHTAKIIFGDNKRPQSEFVYTDLSKEFPGYEFDRGKSHYRDEEVGEGGYVYAEPGIYHNVAVLDVASMHPTSIINLNLFGPYTPKFQDLLEARLAIKHRDFDTARGLLDGRLAPYLVEEETAKDLSYALKIVINIVYGLTAARFENHFKDPRNKDNIVAKRGALFMIDLKHFVQEKGFQVIHIKTDSIKIPDATAEIVDAVMDFGKKYGYDFEHETTYDRIALVNDAVYIAHDKEGWHATGAQFQHPYVFKTLFSKEEVEESDLYEPRHVTQGSMWLDFSAHKPMWLNDKDDMVHVGRSGLFVPVTEESNGGILWRIKDDKRYAVAGTKGYLWLEAEMYKSMAEEGDLTIDLDFYERLANAAVNEINKFGSFEDFAKE